MVRTVDLPDLGAVADDSFFVSDHAGTGGHRAPSLVTYLASKLRGLWFGSGPPSVTWYGATGNGSTDDSAAITAALAASAEVRFPAGTYRISNNVTVARGQRLYFAAGAELLVDTGKTVTIHGTVDAPETQIFAGSGTVTGLRTVLPEWWGALRDNAAFNSQPALQAAHTCVQGSLASDGSRPTIRLGAGAYYVASTWTLAPTANCQLVVIGEGSIFGGSRLVTMSAFGGSPVIYVAGNSDPVQQISDFVLSGFAILGTNGFPTIGLQVGSNSGATLALIGLHRSKIEDIHVDNIPIGMLFSQVTLLTIERCSVWNNHIAGSTCVYISEAGGYTGDMDFVNFMAVGNGAANSQGFVIAAQTAGPTHGVAGLRFRACNTSGCDHAWQIATVGAGSLVHDIWLDNCQADFGVGTAVYVQSTGASSLVREINIVHSWLDGGTDQITLLASAGGTLTDVKVCNNWLAQATGRSVIASGAVGIVVDGNIIADNNNTAGPAIEFSSSTRFVCNNNIATHVGSNFPKYLVQADLGCNYLAVQGNVGAGIVLTATVNDLTGAVTKSVANNV